MNISHINRHNPADYSNSHAKGADVKAARGTADPAVKGNRTIQRDFMDKPHHHINTEAYTYDSSGRVGTANVYQPPVVETVVYETAVDTLDAETWINSDSRLMKFIGINNRELSDVDLKARFTITLMQIAKGSRLQRGETTQCAADYQNTFGDLANAYNKIFEFMKGYFGEDEAEFNRQFSILNESFRNATQISAQKSAEAVAGQFNVFDIENPFTQAAQNHANLFVDTFLGAYQNGHEFALTTALEMLNNMPPTTSVTDISFIDLRILIEAANGHGVLSANGYNSLMGNSSKLSDFMKDYLTRAYQSRNITLNMN